MVQNGRIGLCALMASSAERITIAEWLSFCNSSSCSGWDDPGGSNFGVVVSDHAFNEMLTTEVVNICVECHVSIRITHSSTILFLSINAYHWKREN